MKKETYFGVNLEEKQNANKKGTHWQGLDKQSTLKIKNINAPNLRTAKSIILKDRLFYKVYT